MGFSNLPSDSIAHVDWNHITGSPSWTDPLGPFKHTQPPQNTFSTSQQTHDFPPPTDGDFYTFPPRIPSHTSQVGANDQGLFYSHLACPELPSTHPRTVVTVGSHHHNLEGLFPPDHTRPPVATGPPTIQIALGIARGFPASPVKNPETGLPEARSQASYLDAPPFVSASPEETEPLHPPVEAPLALPVYFTSVVPGTLPSHWVKVPQDEYDYGRRQRDFEPSNPVYFTTGDCPGVNLQDALNKEFTGLVDPNEELLAHTAAILCRFQFSGYPVGGSSCQKIQTLSTASNRRAISRSKLAYEIAKKLKKYLDNMTRIAPDQPMGDCWRIGHGLMRIENMFLVSLVSVSKGSYQPEIWISNPPGAELV